MSNAELLRKELRSIHVERLRLLQVGITLLAAIETALYYIRRDVYEHLGLKPPEVLPFGRFIIGTSILFIIALIFIYLTFSVSKRYHFFRHQYEENCGDSLPLPPRDRWAKPAVILIYVIFPLVDLGIRFWIEIRYGLQ